MAHVLGPTYVGPIKNARILTHIGGGEGRSMENSSRGLSSCEL